MHTHTYVSNAIETHDNELQLPASTLIHTHTLTHTHTHTKQHTMHTPTHVSKHKWDTWLRAATSCLKFNSADHMSTYGTRNRILLAVYCYCGNSIQTIFRWPYTDPGGGGVTLLVDFCNEFWVNRSCVLFLRAPRADFCSATAIGILWNLHDKNRMESGILVCEDSMLPG